MINLYVDFNGTETFDEGRKKGVPVRFDVANKHRRESDMREGLRVCVYDEDIRSEALMRMNDDRSQWLAELIRGTAVDLAPGEYEKLENSLSE